MKIENATALVTGVHRGPRLAFTRELFARGVRKIRAGARAPAIVTRSSVQPLQLDITNLDDVVAAAAPEVTLMINNARIARRFT